MDIEEYLRQKRELEAKKDMLEAKERVDLDKDKYKKEQRAKIYAEHGVTPKHVPEHHTAHDPGVHHPSQPTYRPVSSSTGLWNTLLLFLILILLVVSYFLPRFGEDQIKGVVQQELESKTPSSLKETPEETTPPEKIEETNQTPTETENLTTSNENGPKFIFTVEDDEDGLFDDDGKIDGEIISLNVEQGAKYYSDFTLSIANKETDHLMCKVERDVEIDTDFDGTVDLRDSDSNRYKVEIKPKAVEKITSDVVPGAIDTGTYEGRGDIGTTYTVHCYFCIDDDCNAIDDTSETTESAYLRVFINKDAPGNSTA